MQFPPHSGKQYLDLQLEELRDQEPEESAGHASQTLDRAELSLVLLLSLGMEVVVVQSVECVLHEWEGVTERTSYLSTWPGEKRFCTPESWGAPSGQG